MQQLTRTLTRAAFAVLLAGTAAAGDATAAVINKGQVPAANYRWDTPFGCVPTKNTFMLNEGRQTNNCYGVSGLWGPGWTGGPMPGCWMNDHRAITRQTQNYHEAAYWWPTIKVAGNYEVWVGWRASHNRAQATPYLVYADNATYLYRVNQFITDDTYVGGKWAKLGVHQFAKRTAAVSALVTDTTDTMRKAAGWKVPPGTKGYVRMYNDPNPGVHSEGIDGVGFRYYGPVAPTGLKAAGNKVNGINLTWTQPYGAAQGAITKFQIMRGTTVLATTSTNATKFTDTKAVAGTTNTYRVRAVAYVNGATKYSTWSTAASGSWTDTTPNAFDLGPAVTDAALDSDVTSLVFLVGGLGANVSAPISITGGQYRIDQAAFTAAAGTVHNGQEIQVQVRSSTSGTTTTTATLTIGGVSDTFSVTTVVAK